MRKGNIYILILLALAIQGNKVFSQEIIDTNIVHQIRDQAFNHSQVMDIAFHLTDASGPRLSNSPGLARAQQWSKEAMERWGLQNIQLEPWGTFGKGWELTKCYLAMKEPYYKPLMAQPEAWTKGSDGPFLTDVVLYRPKDSAEQAAFIGKVKGKLFLWPSYGSIHMPFEPEATRYTDSELYKMANPAPRIVEPERPPVKKAQEITKPNPKPRPRIPSMIYYEDFFKQEDILGVLSSGTENRDGTIFVQNGGSWNWHIPLNTMGLRLSFEDLNLLQNLLEAGIQVRLEGDIECKDVKMDSIGYNVIGEIPGTDPVLKDQIVMLGGHLDSWQGATGATDNGAGAAVMLEVVRILSVLHIHPRRTIRIALWSGEELGLHGSLGYVKKHFGDRDTKVWTKDQGKVSAYYNLDNGTGKIRGVYLQQDTAAGPVFQQWLKPFTDLGAATVAVENTGGTDHESFNWVGIPGFQFIQDPIEYETRTHHSNMDTYAHLLPNDLKQASAIVAFFVYATAMRDEMIPRK